MNLSDKMLVTNPTTYGLGIIVISAGIFTVILGVITLYTGDILLPAGAWCAFGIPTTVIGGIMMAAGISRK
jgi:hypothetical protein